MFIEKTTAAERLTISSKLYFVALEFENIYGLINGLLDDCFQTHPQKPFNEYEAEQIGLRLCGIRDLFETAAITYCATVGDYSFFPAHGIQDDAEMALQVAECECLRDQCFALSKKLDRTAGEALVHAYSAVLALPDEEAIPTLKNLLRRYGEIEK